MRPEETFDFHIRWAWAKISRMYNAQAAKHGGTMSIGYVLLNIEKEGTPSTKLGPKMGMEPRSLTRTLKTMEENGFIERRPHESDKRMSLVHLTESGMAMRETSKQAVIEMNKTIHEKLGKQKFENFIQSLSEINDILDRNNIFKS